MFLADEHLSLSVSLSLSDVGMWIYKQDVEMQFSLASDLLCSRGLLLLLKAGKTLWKAESSRPALCLSSHVVQD